MSGGYACKCSPEARKLVVLKYRCNYSAFNGYHRTPSDYSTLKCLTVPCGCEEPGACDWCCGSTWLTQHVKNLKDRAQSGEKHG